MKIGFNPHAAMQAQSPRGPQTQPTPPAPEGADDSVEIALSQAAKQILQSEADYAGNSPAHQARAALLNGTVEFAEDQDASAMPFGQIVKTFAPGHNKEPEAIEEPAPTDGGEVGDVTEPTDGNGTTEGGDTTVADGSDGTGDSGTAEGGDTTVVATPEEGEGIGETDSTIVVEEPDIAEILDETAPAEGGDTTEPEAGIAGSGDAVASTGDVIDELIDALDESGEEIV